MNLSELLTDDLVLFPLRAQDKWQAITALAHTAVGAGGLAEDMFDTVHDALVTREKSMTTGMEQGIAIPHAAIDGIPEAIAVLGVASQCHDPLVLEQKERVITGGGPNLGLATLLQGQHGPVGHEPHALHPQGPTQGQQTHA